MGGDYESSAKEFLELFYVTFDANRQNLGSLYRETSLLTWDGGDRIEGADAIVERLVNFASDTIEHRVQTIDVQPLADGTIVVMVTGDITIDDSSAPLGFAETFVLMRDGGSYYAGHDIFRWVFSA